MATKRPVILWGATGQAKVLSEFLPDINCEVKAVFDNDTSVVSPLPFCPIYYGTAGFYEWLETITNVSLCHFLVAIGGYRGRVRVALHEFLQQQGLQALTAIHPRAWVAHTATIGTGSQILGQAAIGADAIIGSSCIVNTAASVDHECIIEDGVHIAPGAHLAGLVQVGKHSMIGIGASVVPRVTIGSNVIIGAGSVVTKNIPDNVVAYGNPAIIIRENKEQ
jgi:sugar O-acyltransferase (sialic acid O-acetyltransferase NeuD family)